MTSRNTFLHPELICLPQVSSQSQKMFKHRISLGVVCLLSIVCISRYYWSQVTSDADANK